MKPVFIVFEGPDGSGKTSIINEISKFFCEKNIEHIVTREPGGSPLSEKLRDLILDKNSEMEYRTEALLYAAARAEHLEKTVKPALLEGKIVLCDRFVISSIAYQGYGRKLGEKEIYDLNLFATNGFESDLTLFLMTDYKTGLERKKSQKELDRMELQGDSFHKEVYNGYLKLANDNLHRENFFIIDSNRDFKDVYQEVLGIILDKTGFK